MPGGGRGALNSLISLNAWLAGFFALAAVHYAIQWWLSRFERVLLVFSIQCALYSAFSLVTVSLVQAGTIPEVQTALGRIMTLGLLAHAAVLQFYASVSGRRDHAFRALVTLVIVALVVLNQWAPLRGTVIALESIQLPAGGVSLLPIRTSPGVPLVLVYLAVLAVQGYGLFVAGKLWRGDRSGAFLLAASSTAILAGAAIGFLVDFAGLRSPFAGALPHALFVLLMAIFLAREYSARGARIASTERRFEAAFEHAPIGKALLALDGRFLRVNRALCRMLGSTAEEIFTRRLHEVVRDDGEGSIEAESRRLLAGEVDSFTLEKQLVRQDGEPAWVLVAVSVVPDDRGQAVQLITHVRDVTELRAYRERLEDLVATRTRELREAKDEAERASQTKSRFLAHMSHEIRNPLHVILLNAELLERDFSLDAAEREMIETVRASGRHLATIINDVLEMSRIEAGRPELVDAPFDLGATLDEVSQMFAPQASAKGIRLSIELDPDQPRWLLADCGKVKQVLINLVSNAIKFTSLGSVRVTTTSSATSDASTLIEIVVADSGVGIAERDIPRVFHSFEQLDAGARVGGTGLGLAISLAHARLMGGDLSVESTPGVGSAFRFTFVATIAAPDAVREAHGPKRPLEPPATPHKVLIVDDAAENRDLLGKLLAELGFETRSAADGRVALSIHADWGPDIVLMDLRKPTMNGLEAIRSLRAAGSKAAIGALTAGSFGDDERQALGAGADFFIHKPYEGRDLIERIRRALVGRIGADPAPR